MKNFRKIIVIVFLLILAVVVFVSTRGDYLQYKELGENYISIFKTNTIYKYSIMTVNFVLTYIVIYFATRGIKKGLKVFFDQEQKELPKLPNKSISLILAVISSIIVGIVFTPKVILFASNVSFEKTDLIFNLDISFYMFVEPLIKMVLQYIMVIFAFLIVYSAIYYIIVFNRYFDGIDKETLKKSYLINHIIRYIRIIAIVFAINNIISIFDIVFNNFVTTNGGIQLVGAGTVDVTIKVVGNVILSIIIIIAAFLVTINFKKENKSKVIKNLLLVPGYMVVMFIAMFGFDLIFVNSNEYDKEKKYIERNIEYTKNAYGIEAEDNTLEYSGTITTNEIKNNRNILDNAVIINNDLTLEKLNAEQSEKGYYTYKTAGITKYIKDNNARLIYLSPREISSNKRTYNSKTFEYTHGYSALLTSATSTSKDGDIEYIKDNTYIKKPQIYYGLKTDNAVVIDETTEQEYDYTDNKGKEHTSVYKGSSGLKIGFIDRVILGVKTKDVGLAFSSKISKNTKVLVNRNIIKRAKLALSEVVFDENPYVVVDNNGEMFWVLDGYTVSSNYPYSTYTNIKYNGEKRTINYIRNSIKVITNCYDGTMKFYITDDTDPIAMAYKKMYPNIFESKESIIPEDISKQFVYPRFLYDIQSEKLEEYHNTKSEVLYRGDDSWKTASYVTTQNNKTVTTTLDSYYTMVKGENIGLVQMYTPSGKQNLTAYLVGTVENGKNKLSISRLSYDESILGLTQFDNKIDENENIKNEIEKLDVTGAKVSKRIMAVPVENTIIYIEQIFQTKTNEQNSTPLLKKIVIASGNKMALGNNLEEALENIVSQEATKIDTYTTEDLDGVIQSIIKANKNLEASMESKDLELMGKDIKNLQELIKKLEVEKKKEEKQNAVNEAKTNNTITSNSINMTNSAISNSVKTNNTDT